MGWKALKENRNRSRGARLAVLALCTGLALSALSGCGGEKRGTQREEKKIVLTTGFGKDEVFRIGKASCSLPEAYVYLTTTQNQYESVYGEQIWQKELGGRTLEDNVKETVLAKLAQIKSMTLLAQENGIVLSAEEQEKVAAAAGAYYGSLNAEEIAGMGVDEEIIRTMYAEYALACKLYQYIIRDVNPEISDDEARTITVEHILWKTYALDENGEKVEFSDNTKNELYAKAEEALKRARAGEEFGSLVTEYSDDENRTYSFGKGEMDPAFEEAAFNLGTDEISGIVETQYGYHIIKCISTFNREETDANKIKIMDQRREEVFGETYDAFVASLTKELNQQLWDSVVFLHDARIRTTDFFQIFDTYFEESSSS